MEPRTPTAAPGALRKSLILGLLVLIAATLAQLAPAARNEVPGPRLTPKPFAPHRGPFPPCFQERVVGAVYAMTNAADGNQVAVYDRRFDGALSLPRYVDTGGRGSGGEEPIEPLDALGSQGALVLSRDYRWLFAVNAGSDEISVFAVSDYGITLTDRVHSGGDFPSSVTFDDHYLYVLNAGGDSNVTGFELDPATGTLEPLADSTRRLDVSPEPGSPPFFLVSPAQVGFNRAGDMLTVTVKGLNNGTIQLFSVGEDGRLSEDALILPSHGTTPFGFVLDQRDRLLVAEAFGRQEVGTANASAVTSYDLIPDAGLAVVSPSVDNLQTASCWIAATPNGRFAYVTNNASDSITGYRVGRDGRLELLDADGHSAATGAAPVDLAVSADGRYLYNVNAGSGTISTFAIHPDGSLRPLGETAGLPIHDGAVGIAAR